MADNKKKEDKAYKQLGDIEEKRIGGLSDILTIETNILKTVIKLLNEKQDLLFVEEQMRLEHEKKGSLTDDEYETLLKIHKTRRESLATLREETKAEHKRTEAIKDGMRSMERGMGNVWAYLMESDKAMKSMILDFGITSGKAEMMRDALEDSAVQSARLGVNIGEVTEMYRGYVEEVGRVVTLGDKQLIAMTQLAKGTGLANAEAATLAGQFELIGYDLVQTAKVVEGVMETTERMGINATKVLKTIGTNFKKLQTYSFKAGVSGMATLVAHAEKFKIDIGTALGSAEKFRKLDNVIEGAAQLQVLGGEFGNLADGMSMFYESRNDLEAYNDRISKMTKGMATMVETSEGFKLDIASPQARDMLEKAGEALGYSTEQMTEMALQQHKMNTLRTDMIGSGYNKEQKDMIQGMSQLNADTGKYYVMIGNKKRDIVDLSAQELSLLKGEQKSLEDRAKAAQTFDEQFKIFGEELKAVALPLLQGINLVLTTAIRPALDWLTKLFEGITGAKGMWAKIGGVGVGIAAAFLTIGPILKLASSAVSGIAGKLGGIFGGGSKGGLLGSVTGKGGASMMKNMAGLGVAAVGLGLGIKFAAEGISALADSFAQLNDEQLDAVVETVQALGWTMVGVLVPAVIALGIAGSGAALGLGAVGLAALGIGAGIGIAAAGIGYMAEGMGNLLSVAEPSKIFAMAGGMATLSAAALTLANPMSIFGLATMATSVATMASYGDDMLKVGNAFASMNVVLSGTKGQFAEIENSIKAISSLDLSANASFAELASLLKQPLMVQFADKNVGFNVNVDLNIDKNKLISSLRLQETVPIAVTDAGNGTAT